MPEQLPGPISEIKATRGNEDGSTTYIWEGGREVTLQPDARPDSLPQRIESTLLARQIGNRQTWSYTDPVTGSKEEYASEEAAKRGIASRSKELEGSQTQYLVNPESNKIEAVYANSYEARKRIEEGWRAPTQAEVEGQLFTKAEPVAGKTEAPRQSWSVKLSDGSDIDLTGLGVRTEAEAKQAVAKLVLPKGVYLAGTKWTVTVPSSGNVMEFDTPEAAEKFASGLTGIGEVTTLVTLPNGNQLTFKTKADADEFVSRYKATYGAEQVAATVDSVTDSEVETEPTQLLDSGERIHARAYLNLSEGDRNLLNEVGISEFNRLSQESAQVLTRERDIVLEEQTKGYTKIGTGELVPDEDYAKLSEGDRNLLNEVGVERFNRVSQESEDVLSRKQRPPTAEFLAANRRDVAAFTGPERAVQEAAGTIEPEPAQTRAETMFEPGIVAPLIQNFLDWREANAASEPKATKVIGGIPVQQTITLPMPGIGGGIPFAGKVIIGAMTALGGAKASQALRQFRASNKTAAPTDMSVIEFKSAPPLKGAGSFPRIRQRPFTEGVQAIPQVKQLESVPRAEPMRPLDGFKPSPYKTPIISDPVNSAPMLPGLLLAQVGVIEAKQRVIDDLQRPPIESGAFKDALRRISNDDVDPVAAVEAAIAAANRTERLRTGQAPDTQTQLEKLKGRLDDYAERKAIYEAAKQSYVMSLNPTPVGKRPYNLGMSPAYWNLTRIQHNYYTGDKPITRPSDLPADIPERGLKFVPKAKGGVQVRLASSPKLQANVRTSNATLPQTYIYSMYAKSLLALDAATQAQILTQVYPQTIVQMAYAAPAAMSQVLTNIATATSVNTSVKTAVKQAVQTAINQAVKTATATGVDTATLPATSTQAIPRTGVLSVPAVATPATTTTPGSRVGVRAIPRTNIRTRTRTGIKPPPFPKLPKLLGGGGEGGRIPVPLGSLAWKQGYTWKYLPPPWRADKPVSLNRGEVPQGAKLGGNTPAATIQIVGRTRAKVPKTVNVDLGVVDIFVLDYGKRIEFAGSGEDTNVGTSLDSNTTGLTIDDAFDFTNKLVTVSKSGRKRPAYKRRNKERASLVALGGRR